MSPMLLGVASKLRLAARRRPRPRLVPSAEALESRRVLDGSVATYTWTALGDGTSFNDPNNWSHAGPYGGGVGVTGVPSLGSNLVFPPFYLLPADSPTTVDFNGSYGSYPFNSVTIEDSYTFDGNGVAVGVGGIVVANPAFGGPTVANILLASVSLGVNLGQPATVDTLQGTTLNIDTPTNLTGVQLTLPGGLTKSGGGQLAIDTPTITEPRYGLQLQTFAVDGGAVTLGTAMDFSNTLFQVDAGSSLDVADDAAVKVGSLSGQGTVDLEGTGAAGDTTGLTAFTPAGETDQFAGSIAGAGAFAMQGDGTLTLGGIALGPTSAVDVVLGTLDVAGPIAAGTLQVQSGTFGGLGSWHFDGPASFQGGSTFDVALDGLAAGTQSTQLTSGDTATGITLGDSTLAGTVAYEYQAGDSFTIATGPMVQGAFQNVVDGMVLLGGNIPFAVTYAGTSVTLTAEQSVSTTQLSSSGSPSHPGQPVTFTATVGTRTRPVTAGSVTFAVGGVVVATEPLSADGTARFTTTSLGLGGSTITAAFDGSGNILGSTGAPLTQLVVPYSTATTVSSSTNPSRIGQAVALTATVTADGMPVTSGTVTFSRGSQRLGTAALGPAGTATLTTSALPKGEIRIQASFGGNPDDFGSVSPAFVQAVARYDTETTLSAAAQARPDGRIREVLVAAVDAAGAVGVIPTGTVVFRRDGRTIGRARLAGGTAAVVLAPRIPPRGRFVASFRRNGTFAASTSAPLVLPA